MVVEGQRARPFEVKVVVMGGEESAGAPIVIACPQVDQARGRVVLFAGIAVDGTAAAAAGQQFDVGFVGGGAVYRIAHHLDAHAAQAVGQQGTGLAAVVLLNQAKAQQVVSLDCTVVADQNLGEAAVVVGVGSCYRLAAAVVDLLQAVAITVVDK